MTRNIIVELFGPGGNFAAIRMPDRQSYGVVFQADSLKSLVGELQSISMMLEAGESEEAFEELAGVLERLTEVATFAEREVASALGSPAK